MDTRKLLAAAIIAALVALLVPRSAAAGDAPDYSSDAMSNLPSQWGFGTPEEDGRPGQYYFVKAIDASKRRQYRFAIDMYQASASWAYKPAQYNLAIAYLKGDGVPVDKPRAMAWAALAAERNDAEYVEARELIYADLSNAQFAKANDIWRELKTTYADDVALERAKTRWAQVKAGITGSRVGGVGALRVGAPAHNVKPVNLNLATGKPPVDGNTFGPGGILTGGSVDGATAYRQLRESDNPYDPKFVRKPIGTATVEPIVPVPEDREPGDTAEHPRNT
jgi:Sel1 repeat-containing protein